MNATEFRRYDSRVRFYGFTPDEAFHCPSNKPLWMYRLEQERGMTFAAIAKKEFQKLVAVRGKNGNWRFRNTSIQDFSESIGKCHATTLYWIRKLREAGDL